MSETSITPAVSTDPAPLQTPTTTFYQQSVDDFWQTMNGAIVGLPDIGLGSSHPTTDKFVRTHQNVPLEFLASAIAAVEQNPSVAATQTFDTVKMRDTLQFVDAYTPFAERLTAFRDTVDYTLKSKRADLTALCLQIYAVVKGLARHAGAASGPISLATHVQTMKRNLGRRGRKAGGSNSQPQTPTTEQKPEPRENAAQA